MTEKIGASLLDPSLGVYMKFSGQTMNDSFKGIILVIKSS